MIPNLPNNVVPSFFKETTLFSANSAVEVYDRSSQSYVKQVVRLACCVILPQDMDKRSASVSIYLLIQYVFLSNNEKSRFTFGLNAAKNTHYNKKSCK